MRFDPRAWIAPVVGALVLTLIMHHTISALRSGATWRDESLAAPKQNPYAPLDFLLSTPDTSALPTALRDPFGYAPRPTLPRPAVVRTPAPVAQGPAAPPEVPMPTLTAIIWDTDPRATVRFDGRDFSVRENSLFADFTVKTIRPNEVVLDRNGQSLVLRLEKKGD
jgi:hypothetical protein